MLRLQVWLSVLALCWLSAKVESAGLKLEFSWDFISFNLSPTANVCATPQEINARASGKVFAFPKVSAAPKRRYATIKYSNGTEGNIPHYVYENNIPMGATRYKNKVFVTIPRRKVGIPATLNYVSLDCQTRHNVPLTPYPSLELNSWEVYRIAEPSNVNAPLINVYRTTVDACHRLWLIDMGTIEYSTGRDQIRQFAIVVIDLTRDRVIRRYPFEVYDVDPAATLASITVDVTNDTCHDAYAYIPDLVNYKMLVYSWKQDDSWRISHDYFHIDPLQGDFFIGGYNFMWDDGIFSIALSKVHGDGYRTAYFHSLASTNEFSVSTNILRNRTLATRSYHGRDFKLIANRGEKGQTATHNIHAASGLMFLAVVNKNGLYCWNINHHPLTHKNLGLVKADSNEMVYPSDVEIDDEDNVWVMTNSMPKFLYGTPDFNETNFRIWSNNIYQAVKNTPCAHKK